MSYPVWIDVQNGDLRLRPSMTANIRIEVERADAVIAIPNQALRFRPTADAYAWLGMTPPPAIRRSAANPTATDRAPAAPIASTKTAAPVALAVANQTGQIDDLFAVVEKRVQPGQVWIYDEHASDPSRRLRPVDVRVGVTDGRITELASAGADLPVGTRVVIGIVGPASTKAKSAAAGGTNIFDQRGPGGFGGPGTFGPPPGFGGGGPGGRGGD